MCVTAALPIISLAATAVSGVGSLMSASASQQQADAQAQAYREQAKTQETAFALRQEDRNRRQRRMIAEQRALYGASGVELTGTPETVMVETAGEFAREAYQDRFQTDQQVRTLEQSANNVVQTGHNQAVGTLLDFGGSVLNRGFGPVPTYQGN